MEMRLRLDEEIQNNKPEKGWGKAFKHLWKRTSSLDIDCLYNLISVFIKVYKILQKSYQPYFKILTINYI